MNKNPVIILAGIFLIGLITTFFLASEKKSIHQETVSTALKVAPKHTVSSAPVVAPTLSPEASQVIQGTDTDAFNQNVIDEMSPKAIEAEITKTENKLNDENVIERLNNNETTEQERNQYSQLFFKLNRLRAKLIELELEETQKMLAEYQATHQNRLQQFGIVE